jgi:hypothetical protein
MFLGGTPYLWQIGYPFYYFHSIEFRPLYEVEIMKSVNKVPYLFYKEGMLNLPARMITRKLHQTSEHRDCQIFTTANIISGKAVEGSQVNFGVTYEFSN